MNGKVMRLGKTCCPSGAPKVTMVNVGGVKVGIIALGEIFKKLYESGKNPEDVKKEELVKEFSIYNYIPSEAQNEYAEALMEEYRNYCKEKSK
ncbi:MAG: hypothetical protein LUQ20_01235 [Candidatus Methanoperedens sp.]|jgi:hypothetical protein|nr:hypothetical protein [Candidatus Methanoperedens sp.]